MSDYDIELPKNSIEAFFQNEDKLWELLPDSCDGYMFGGCYVAAHGIQKHLHSQNIPSKLMAVWYQNQIEHVIVKVNDLFIDSEGSLTAKEMIQKIEEYSFRKGMRIAPVTNSDLANSDIWYDAEAVEFIAESIQIEEIEALTQQPRGVNNERDSQYDL